MKNLIEFDFLAFVLVKDEIWPPVPVWGKEKRKKGDLIKISSLC